MQLSLSTQFPITSTYSNPIPGREFILSLFDNKKITEHLVNPQQAAMETKLARRRHRTVAELNTQLSAKAHSLGSQVAEKDKVARVDYRDLSFVTIDGADAKYFDDAVYCEKNQLGDWRLLVAIADVSHYIKSNDALDIEAQQRATSIYFPDKVVPMLPEALSNGLCSLSPNEDRLVMVCDMTISCDGIVTQSVFTEGLIRSHARLTYNQAYALVAQPDSKLTQNLMASAPKIMPQIKNLHCLYGALIQQRKQRGALAVEMQELAIKRNTAHRMVEEFMLCANVATAQFLQRNKIPTMVRVHADTSIIQALLLRPKSQTKYSTDSQEHLALTYEAYANFTSPIRRYTDLLTHRAIREKIRSGEQKNGLQWLLHQLNLDKIGN
jgi:ribonuclease R